MKSLLLLILTAFTISVASAQKSAEKLSPAPITGDIQVFDATDFVVPAYTDIQIAMTANGTSVTLKSGAAPDNKKTSAAGQGIHVVLTKTPPAGKLIVSAVSFMNSKGKVVGMIADANGRADISNIPEGVYSISVNGHRVVTNFRLGKRITGLKNEPASGTR